MITGTSDTPGAPGATDEVRGAESGWRPTASLDALQRRARMLAQVREFFASRGVLEVETPILSAGAVSDPQIESLTTRVAGMAGPSYLSTSPEYAMKRLLAAGSGDIYQVCKVFRDAERGRWHNPEFTLLEWYRLGFDDAALMEEVEALLVCLLAPDRRPLPAERLSYAAALQRHAGVDVHCATADELAEAAHRHGIDCHAELDRDA
ncbi:MAG TPA: amino acid--tRNA ligase-related protein, partial [Steroidobacteraceae bacterium]|nr:amino acid--tRNA ligase-related protein [Steroidobacteraceae bacterium]